MQIIMIIICNSPELPGHFGINNYNLVKVAPCYRILDLINIQMMPRHSSARELPGYVIKAGHNVPGLVIDQRQ